MTNMVRAAVLAFCVLVTNALIAAPQVVEDPAATQLARARELYEREVESIRADVLHGIGVKREKAKKAPKDSVEAVARLNEELRAFERTGAMPDIAGAEKLEQDYAKAAEKMRKAYANAMADGKEAGFRSVVTEECRQFERCRDLNPWGTDLLEGKSIEQRTLNDKLIAVGTATGLRGAYRIEVRAKRAGSAGSMSIEFPLANEKHLRLPVSFNAKGEARVLLSVYEGLVSADMGVDRPVDLLAAADVPAAEAQLVNVRGDGGSIAIESVRVKPVIKGAPPEVKAPAKKQAEETKHESPFAAGMSWQGRDLADENEMKKIRLTSVSGGRAEFELPGSSNGAVFRISGRISGTVVNVDDVDRIKSPKNSGAARVTSASGTVQINADGTLTMKVSSRMDVDGRKNILKQFTFTNAARE